MRFLRLSSAVCLLDFRIMAGVLGFEPRNAGIKTLCLTTWRHPNNLRDLLRNMGAILQRNQ